jgi:hypothetical protein
VRRPIWRWVQAIGGALVVIFVVRYLAANWAEVQRAPLDLVFRPGWVVASLALVLGTYLILIESWRRMLAGWGPLLPFRDAARVWVVSSMGKYIPGKVWAIAGMALLAQRRGVPPWAATASALLLQVVSIGTGALIVGLTGAAALEARLPGSTVALWALIAGSTAGLLLIMAPRVARLLLRRVGSGAPEAAAPSRSAVAFGVLANGLAWVTYGIALWLLARGVLPEAQLGLADAIAGFAASYIAGYLFLLAPGGLGVRESVFVIMLEPRIGLGNALALAAVSRLGMTAADILAALPFVRTVKETARHAT